MMSGFDLSAVDVGDLTQVCMVMPGEDDLSGLLRRLSEVLPGLPFSHVLSRGGWHRIGGVVDGDYQRVADHIDRWVEHEAEGDVTNLLDKYEGAGFFATRIQGTTHYLTAPCGDGAAEFVQLEIEEQQEVLDRYLIDPDWFPDDLEEFIDPMDYPRLEPEAVGEKRYVFRRLVQIPEWLQEREEVYGAGTGLARWFADWDASSSSLDGPMCRYWVMGMRESMDSTGCAKLSGRPVAVVRDELPAISLEHGAPLANQLHAFDKAAGYPFAWYFHMLATTGVAFDIGEAVVSDLDNGFTYLPERDAAVLRGWAAAHYAP